MTFERMLPVIKRMRLIPWICFVLVLVLAILALPFIFSHPSQDVTAQQKADEALKTKVMDKLTDLKNQTVALKNQVAERLEGQPIKSSHRSSGGGGGHFRPQLLQSGIPAGDTSSTGFQSLNNASKTETYIPTGSVFQGQLIMPIKTSIQQTFVMVQTTHEYRMDGVRRIPKGSKLIGHAQLNPMLKGVVVRFNMLVTPKGIEYPVSVIALSPSLFPELSGLNFSNKYETYAAALAFGFVGGFANAAQDRTLTPNGFQSAQDVGNQAKNGLASASFSVANEIINDVRRQQVEYVVVPAGLQIFLVFDQHFVIKEGKSIQ